MEQYFSRMVKNKTKNNTCMTSKIYFFNEFKIEFRNSNQGIWEIIM